MATNLRIKAAGRSADVEAAIRDALMAGDSAEAVTVVCAALRSEAKKFRERRHGDGPLADAEIAATLLFSLAGLHVYKPLRLPGCPRVPGPADLVATFEATLTRLADEAAEAARKDVAA
jgi:hypothetical protein